MRRHISPHDRRKSAPAATRLKLESLEDRSVPAGIAGAGTGLVGDYFSDTTLTNLAATRLDAGVDFAWPGSPAAGVAEAGFSVRWSGEVQPRFTENYAFTVTAGAGVRLFVNDQAVVNQWAATSTGTYSGSVTLQAGELYDIRLEALGVAGPDQVKLAWASPSTPLGVVPASQLYPSSGWLGTDIGPPGAVGSITSAGSTYTVRGAGTGSATADQGHFAHQQLDGDGVVVARVGSVTGSTTAGLMIRESTAANAPFASITVNGSGTRFDFRGSAGAASMNAGLGNATGPVWLKLRRNGDLVFGYTSSTGADGSWNLVGTATVRMAPDAQAGMFVKSGGNNTAAATFSNVSVQSVTPLGANLDSITDFSISKVFVDAFKQSRAPTSQMPGEGGQPANVDANGWATEDAEYYIQTGAVGLAHVFNGTYKLSFTGRATIDLGVTQGTVSNVVYNAGSNKTTADVTLVAPENAGWDFMLRFVNTTGGVKDIKLIRPGYDANTTQTFTNEFLAAVKPFQTLRFMDWLRTNDSPNVNWFERVLPTVASQGTSRGVAWEHIVELANITGKDVWVNIPFHATDAYVRNLAEFLHDNLGQDRVVYLEFSNEVWNPIFSQFHDNVARAVQEVEAGMTSGTPSELFYPGETAQSNGEWVSRFDWAFRRVARELKQITDLFAAEWGSDAITTRVRPVLANQLVVPYIARTQLEFLQLRYGPPKEYLTAIAGTSFLEFHEHDGAALTADQILIRLAESLAEQKAFYSVYTDLAASYGVRSFATEGGVDTFGQNNKEAKAAASLDPRIRPLVEQLLANWYGSGGGQFNWFVAGATRYDTNFGTWGLTNDITNLNTPKYVGVRAAAEAPPPDVTFGTAIPAAVPATGYYGSTSVGQQYAPSVPTGAALDYHVRAPVSGGYRLLLEYAAATAGRIEILVDGEVAATVDLAVTGPARDGQFAPVQFSTSAPIVVPLPAGLSEVRIRVVAGGFSLRTLTFAAPTGVLPPPPPSNQPPTVAANATATQTSATTATLSARGNDDAGEANLRYTWTVVSAPSGAPPVTFSENGTNAARQTTATFGLPGIYVLRVTMTDAGGLSATTTTTYIVNPNTGGGGDAPTNAAPTVAAPAAAVVDTPTSAALSVLGADDGGEANLTYTWTVIGAPAGAGDVRFAANGTNAARQATVVVDKAGTYSFRVTITDAAGASTTSAVSAAVNAVLSGLTVTPGSVELPVGGVRQFAASGRDQFGDVMDPGAVTWSVEPRSAGTITAGGRFTAGDGPAVVRAAAGGLTAAANVTVNSFLPPTDADGNPPADQTPTLTGYPGFGVGAGVGAEPRVRLYDATGTERLSVLAFDAGFTGGVRTAVGDFNGDGVPDLVVGTGPGIATLVRVLDGRNGTELFAVAPFEAAFTGGVYVAAGDVTGDGIAELIVTPDEGGGPRVRVFDGATFTQINDFFGIEDPNFRGGARAAVGDINGDGVGDLIVAAGFGGGPRIAVFDGRSVSTGTNRPEKFFGDLLVFEDTLRNGVYVTSGDLDGDGRSDLIVGGGPGGGPRVFALSGAGLMAGEKTQLANFFAGDTEDRNGVRVAVAYLNGDDRADVLAAVGPTVTSYLGSTIQPDGTPPTLDAVDAFPGFQGGVFVG